jgi:HEAT repeat protein
MTMCGEIHPRDDRRSTDELFTAMLTEIDDHGPWSAVAVLHFRGTREVLERASVLCRSHCAFERTWGANVLGQLGVPERTFPRECGDILLQLLRQETNADVLQSVFIALYHLSDARVIPLAGKWLRHPDTDVRYAIAFALAGHEDPRAINMLIQLTADQEACVRDWATFGLGTQMDVDTPAVRDALVARFNDSDDDARGEGLVASARRGDCRVIPALKRELASGNVGTLAVEAALLTRSPELHAELVALRTWWDVDLTLLEEAIRACPLV